MKTIKSLTLILMILFIGMLYAQNEIQQVTRTEKSRTELGQTQKMEGEVVLGVGNTGLRYEEPVGSFKKVVDVWGKIGIDMRKLYADQWKEEQRQEISNALRAFLSNSPAFFVAELDQDRLNAIGDEFNLVELGGAEFRQAKQAGKWAGLDYLVRIDAVQGSRGENLVVAEMIDINTQDKITAVTAQKGQMMNNIALARNLARNLEAVYQAPTKEEKELVQSLQRAEARALSVSKDSQWMLKITGIGYTTSAVTGILSHKVSGWIFGPLFAGPLAYVSWKGLSMTKKEYNAALDEYDQLIEEYNRRYGEKYVDYYR